MADEAADAMRRGLRISTRTAAGPPQSLDVVCKFFLRGFCANGDACRFLHPAPEETQGPPPPAFAAPAASDYISAAGVGAGAGAAAGASGSGRASAPMCVPQAARSRTEEREYVDFATAYASVFRPSSLESGAGSAASPSYLSSLAEERSRTYSGVAGAGVEGAGEGATRGTGAPLSMRPSRVSAPGGASAAATMATAAVLCKFHADGNCRYGAGCMYTHGTFCSLCQKNVLHPTDNALAAAHVRACEEGAERRAHASAGATAECGICMENPTAHGRKFGLLQNCDHPFCLECVRSWRGSDNAEVFGRENVRSCPLCRVASFVIIPSDTFETDPEEKSRLMESYRGKLSRIPCKHFKFGDGACPFGMRCMYAHVDREGREQADPDLVFNDTGSSVKKTATLLDYL